MVEKNIYAEASNRLPALVLLALLVGNLALAFGPWLVRSADVGPSASAFWRMVLAIPFLFVIAQRTRQPLLLTRRTLYWTMILSGAFFALDLAAWHIGILKTKLANATLFANAASLFFPVWGYLVARSWPGRLEGFAFALALAGTVLLLGRSAELSRETLIGDLLCLAAGIFYTGYLIVVMKARDELPSWTLLAWSTLATAPPLLLIALALGEQIMPSNWTPVVALAVVSQLIGQGLMVYVLGKVTPLLFGLALLTQPLVSATIGWLQYGERLGPADAAGARLIASAL
ncbi:MAG: DMT family transporter, partial [Sphingomonadaceae bacterium]|nr:DMT family transporter [Sphingomonadaceae bacterium]